MRHVVSALQSSLLPTCILTFVSSWSQLLRFWYIFSCRKSEIKMSRKGSPLITKEPEYSENTDIQWALDLLKPDPNHELSILQKYASEVVCMGSGFAIACLRNNLNRRPIFAGKCICQYTMLLIETIFFHEYILQHNLITRLCNMEISFSASCLFTFCYV